MKIFISTIFAFHFILILSPLPKWDLNGISFEILGPSSSYNITLYEKSENMIDVKLLKQITKTDEVITKKYFNCRRSYQNC